LKRIQRMPNIPLAYVSVYRRMSDIFHTLTYACPIRNSVTGPLTACSKLVDNLGQAVRTQLVEDLLADLLQHVRFYMCSLVLD
jgi:hypothetical protein